MTNKKITEMGEMTTPALDDYITTIDTSAAAGSKNKKMSFTNLYSWVQSLLDLVYAPIANGVTNGDSHDHSGGDGAQIDHGGLGGLSDDDHTQYIKHSLADAASDFLVASGDNAFVKKTLAETRTILDFTRHITTNTTITVGAGKDYTTIQGALNSLDGYVISNGATVTIQAYDALDTTPIIASGYLCAPDSSIIIIGDSRTNSGQPMEITAVSRAGDELTFTIGSWTSGNWSSGDDCILPGFEDSSGSGKFDIKSVDSTSLVVENSKAWTGSSLGNAASITSIAAANATSGRQTVTCSGGVDSTNIKAGMKCYITGTTANPNGEYVNDSGAAAGMIIGTASGATGFNVNGLTLKVKLDGATSLTTITFSGSDPISLASVISQINAAYGSTIADAYNTNYLRIKSTTTGMDSAVWIDSTSTALTVLGFNGTGLNNVWHHGVNTLFRVAAVTSTTITLVNHNGIAQAGAGGTLFVIASDVIPKSPYTLQRTTSGNVFTSYVPITLQGFHVQTHTSGTCYGVKTETNGYIILKNCSIKANTTGVYISGRGCISMGKLSIIGGSNGIYAGGLTMGIIASYTKAFYCSYVGIYSIYEGTISGSGTVQAIGCANGFLAAYMGFNYLQSLKAFCCTIGFDTLYHSFNLVTGAYAIGCGTGFRAYYHSFLWASTTLYNCTGNTTNYSPSSSDTEGNVSAIITYS